ncbi:hypothetical protein KP509_33G052300 [Ceratopteris richardii]|uniref:Uncharacterized protein n=1 Tax=Ceratopteris richardii TaxID=49495 RepID=A0A8T2QR34_CERRI|nr:hypothetical protein KP509_33G052300 [Ceratopteris richardii]
MLGWSLFADQMLNSRCIMDGWGIGLLLTEPSHDVKNEIVSRQVIESKVRAFMLQLPALSKNCNALKEAAIEAAKGIQSSVTVPLMQFLTEKAANQ